MPTLDLTGKTVYDLDLDQFDRLYCRQCKDLARCDQDFKSVACCQQLVDLGRWESLCRKAWAK